MTASEHGNFRKAAATLGTRESTIRGGVRDLEDRLGASLFHRHSGGIRLTVAGERYFAMLAKFSSTSRWCQGRSRAHA
ncbi:LysR family transcriptional regulator [Mesorhizobium sp. VK23B]|uniref:LysR family transcriptional regulator n=1 Tax=Mesorhizobium dulcispinae TaxID=3072316 RepID=A0ABU4XMV2_9HYPH|nr:MULTISPECIES: LysR family transcriptional regulator [unclassified Mesorhizobium]MDX8469744.1 LysR family transcriptional regulator [Mesorhizobium sp. VK23B]MDX8476083.1 LysR family transcriptional regulator [Mesorhizobium sp. VK23A]